MSHPKGVLTAVRGRPSAGVPPIPKYVPVFAFWNVQLLPVQFIVHCKNESGQSTKEGSSRLDSQTHFLVAAPIATPASDCGQLKTSTFNTSQLLNKYLKKAITCRIVSSREIDDRSRFDILDNIGGARVHLGSHDVGEGER